MKVFMLLSHAKHNRRVVGC